MRERRAEADALRRLAGHRIRRCPIDRRALALQSRTRLVEPDGQPAMHGVGPRAGARLVRAARGGNARRDQPRPLRLVVPGDDPVVEGEHRVRQGEIIVARRGKALQHPAEVVREISGEAALKGRQLGAWRDGVRRDDVPRHLEGGAGRFSRRAGGDIDDLRPRATRTHDEGRIGGDERVAPEACRVARAVEEETIRSAAEPFDHDERVGCRGELVDERQHIVAYRYYLSRRRSSFTCSRTGSSGGVR